MRLRIADLGLIVLASVSLSGCHVVTMEDLQANSRFHGSYQFPGSYEACYKMILSASEAQRMQQRAGVENFIHHAIFPDEQRAYVAWQFDSADQDESVVLWLCDILPSKSGTLVEAYALNEYEFRRVDKLLRLAGVMRQEG
jgi:hypothetical protein